VTGNDQGRRIPGHRLADVARRLATGADLLRQRAIGGRAAPADPAQGVVDPAEEWLLAAEVEPDVREVGFLAVEVSFRRGDNRRNIFGRRARLCPKARRRIKRSAASALFTGN
jgi:hypothetical protein